jgi:hypothetical protein
MKKGLRRRAQGPRLKEINSSFFRYALGAMRYAVNRNKE